jgi:leader peptidase (prepilin peptidase)/N-methyltransferase
MFDPANWARVPFHFWSAVLFVFGCTVGSFLNVCIHRMPRGESVVSPPSHCPHCGYAIPWYLNIPLVTWLWLGARCANCRQPISARYFVVELLTGLAFLGSWLVHGPRSPGLALAYCLLLAAFIAATFIDFDHFIIPDEITLGGIAAGFVLSFVVPALHDTGSAAAALRASAWGIAAGAGVVYGILRLGKVLFGRHRVALAPGSKITFTELALQVPGQEDMPYGDFLYRKSDTLVVHAQTALVYFQAGDENPRAFDNVTIRLSRDRLQVGEEEFDPGTVPRMEVVTDQLVLPREAMGLGDVKFMAAIGAFLGWPGVIFSLTASAILGSFVGMTLIVLRKREWSSKLPYGPYIAVAATLWIFGGKDLFLMWLQRGPALL